MQGISHQPSLESFIHVLLMCRLERNQACALHLHAVLCNCGLDGSAWFGNHLVSLLADVGIVHTAWYGLARLLHRTVSSWNSLIAGFVKHGDSQCALTLYKRMQEDSLQPNGRTYVALLKACTDLKDVCRGCELHAAISKQVRLKKDLYVNSMLVHMYATFGLLANALEVFDTIPCPNVVAWNALITGYANNGHGTKALLCINQMQHKGIIPTAITYVSGLKACGSIGDTEMGRDLHAKAARRVLPESNVILQSALVDMYAKCGSLARAQEVFDKLSIRNIITWTALITGYTKHEYGKEALYYYEQMRLEGISPNAVTYASSLKACGIIGAIDKGNEIFVEISDKRLWKSELTVGNALIDMYIKCDALARAQEVFNELPSRDVVTWNALITGYANNGLFEKTLDSFEHMTREGIYPNAVSYIFFLKACGSIRVINKGRDLHAEVVQQGLFDRDLMVRNAVVDMYAKCGLLKKAQEVFDQLWVRDVVSWTVLISGYVEQNFGKEALKYNKQMHLEGVYLNPITFIYILQACGSIKDVDEGRRVHTRVARNMLLERDPAVCSALIDMYGKCGSVSEAKEVFDRSSSESEIVWNSMLGAYANHDHCKEALEFFEMMNLNGLPVDKVTFLYCLKACGIAGMPDCGAKLHAGIAIKGLLSGKDNVVSNALVHMYATCGLHVRAEKVLHDLVHQDTVSWTALISGYVNHNYGKAALISIEQMILAGFCPNAVTFILGLKACAVVGALERGQEMHSEIARRGFLEKDQKICSSLISMYAGCGQLAKTQEVFNELASHNVILWNTLISGYAKYAKSENAVLCFEEMQHEGVPPNGVTFLNLLNACNHAGLVKEGDMYYNDMSADHGLSPAEEHERCMADLLGRVGDLDGARGIFMSSCSNPVVVRSTLKACQNFGNVKLGRAVFECALR